MNEKKLRKKLEQYNLMSDDVEDIVSIFYEFLKEEKNGVQTTDKR